MPERSRLTSDLLRSELRGVPILSTQVLKSPSSFSKSARFCHTDTHVHRERERAGVCNHYRGLTRISRAEGRSYPGHGLFYVRILIPQMFRSNVEFRLL